MEFKNVTCGWALKWNQFGLYNGKRVVEFENFMWSWALKLIQVRLNNETMGFIRKEFKGIWKYNMQLGFTMKSMLEWALKSIYWALKSMLGLALKSIYRTL